MAEFLNISFPDLPPSFLLQLFRHLPSYKDIIALQLTCKHLFNLGRSWSIWTDRLEREYGLRLKTTGECEDETPLKLFRETISVSTELRYWGVFTDGGCDEQYHTYWVDNAFTSITGDAFCSELGTDVHCIGIMVDGILDRDAQTLADREYMVQRCKLPAGRVLNDLIDGSDVGQRLHSWTTHELVHFMLTLYHDWEMGGMLGAMLFADLDENEVAEERRKMDDLVRRIDRFQKLSYFGILRYFPAVTGLTSDVSSMSFATKEHHDPHLYYYDTNFTEVYNTQIDCPVVGVIESVTISRQGQFSCPVATGVLFSVQFRQQNHNEDIKHEELVNRFVDISESHSCLEFADKVDFQSIMEAHEKGDLSCEILSQGQSAVGQWIEFESKDSSHSLVTPLLWFHFYSREEIQQQSQQDWLVMNDPDQMDQDVEHEIEANSDISHSQPESLPDMNMDMLFEAESSLGDLEDLAADFQAEDEQMLAPMEQLSSSSEENQMTIPLTKRVGANGILLKLITQENRMTEMNDFHPNPNIDINSVVLQGKKIVLPKGLYCV
eukprot:g5009.t1